MTVASGASGAASGHPLAAKAASAVLRQGGSAVDAALGAAFTQWVVSAPMCGPGGDLVLLYAHQGVVEVFGGWSSVPLRLDPRADLVSRGPGAVVAPAALRGAEKAWLAGGRLPWRELFGPALDAAAGHEVTPWMASAYERVGASPNSSALAAVLDVADLPVAGDAISASRLGKTLALIAEQGADALHGGDVGQRVDDAARRDGATVSLEDLVRAEATHEKAERRDLPDLTLHLPGPPSQAGITGDLLAAVDPDVDPASRAFADAVAPLTERRLTDRCTSGLGGTAVSVAADGEGGAAVVVHSLAGVQFGAGWVAGDSGVALGNRVGTALSTRESLPAANPRPGERIPHTLSAAHVEIGSRSVTLATPGGDRQVQWLAQAVQRIRRGTNPEHVVADPRWFVSPVGDRFGVPAGIGQQWFAFAEPGIEWVSSEWCGGYAVRRVDDGGGGLQAADRHDGSWTLASDPRSGGLACAERG